MATLLGHTLGTPHHSLFEALDLFASCGLDGAELIWLDGYPPGIPESARPHELESIAKRARQLGLVIGCVTPYVDRINSPDHEARERSRAQLSRCIEAASALGSERIRVYGGAFPGTVDEGERALLWGYLVESLGELSIVAERNGVTLCIENHFSTMTESAEQTVALVREVDSQSVGILYDQANLTFTHCEDSAEAVSLQGPWIRHVHVKDLEFIDPNRRLSTASVSNIQPEDRVHRSRMIGDGILDWVAIISKLKGVGYDGTYALEYEYRWNPDDLPDPDVGFPLSAERLREAVLAATG